MMPWESHNLAGFRVYIMGYQVNLYQRRRRKWHFAQLPELMASWWKFSKVSNIVNLHSKFTSLLSFENFYQDPQRLVFNPKIGDYYQHINKLGNCRLFFDAPKYNAHTSAGDAIWAGVPVISAPHEMMVHRGAACFLAATNVTATIVRNIDDYRLLALRLARSPRKLEQTRSLFQATRDTANMFNTPRWTRCFVCFWGKIHFWKHRHIRLTYIYVYIYMYIYIYICIYIYIYI